MYTDCVYPIVLDASPSMREARECHIRDERRRPTFLEK